MSILEEIETQVEAMGFVKGTEKFEVEVRAKKVPVCKLNQNVVSCWDCRAFDSCNLIKQHLIDENNKGKKKTFD